MFFQLVHPAIQVIRLNNFLSLPFPQIWKSGHKGQDGKQSLLKPVDHSQVGSETISSKLFRLPKNVKWDYTSPVETFANKVLKKCLGINVFLWVDQRTKVISKWQKWTAILRRWVYCSVFWTIVIPAIMSFWNHGRYRELLKGVSRSKCGFSPISRPMQAAES